MVSMDMVESSLIEDPRPRRAYCIDAQRVGLAWVEERRVSNGFEMIRLQALTMHIELMAELELKEPGTFYRAVCAMYPLDPRPSPVDILSVNILHITKPLHHCQMEIILRRGHYIGGPPSSIPHYQWEDYEPE